MQMKIDDADSLSDEKEPEVDRPKGICCPAKLYMIKDMPTGMLVEVLSRVYQSEFGNRFLYRHAILRRKNSSGCIRNSIII